MDKIIKQGPKGYAYYQHMAPKIGLSPEGNQRGIVFQGIRKNYGNKGCRKV